MDGILRLRAWLQEQRLRGVGGFSVVEILVAVAILGVMAGISSLAFGGFDSAASSISCKADKTRLQRARVDLLSAKGPLRQ